MRTNRSWAVTLWLGASLALLGGCGGDSTASQIDRSCNTVCGKMSQCMLLVGTLESCVTSCRQNASRSSSSSACTVSESQANACISAVDRASCAIFSGGGLPSECALCGGGGGGGGDAGGGGGDAGGGGADAGSGGCATLARCCATLPADQQNGCNQLAASGNGSLCATTITGYQLMGRCR